MATVLDIWKFIESLAPQEMKEDWDHVGLNCGHTDREVSSILVALDPFEAVCKEAKELGADLLITHHALLWKPGFITDLDQQGKNTLYLIENNIAHINAHTNLDCAPGGVNDILAQKLGLENIQVISPKGLDVQGRPWGLLRCGCVAPQSLESFLKHVKTALGCKGLKYTSNNRPIHKVAVGGGACAGELQQVIHSGCDTFVTSDVRYNQFWDAKNAGINLIDAGHFHTENPVCDYLVAQLQAAFPDITVTKSACHTDCAEFF